jgi:membrane protein implicated in regulation of membrane protease activity
VNPIAGAGAVLILALGAILLSGVSNTAMLLLVLSIVVVAFCTLTYMASVRRRRRDRRSAGG